MIKHRQRILMGLFISALSLVIAVPVQAQPKVNPTPTNLMVVGKRCVIFNLGCTEIERNLLLRSDQAISDVQIRSLDLPRADGVQVLPANAIKLNSSSSNLATDDHQLLTIPLAFDFRQVPSGEFSGVLLVVYAGGELSIPVTVRVKDHWLIPLLVLLLGVALGLVVSYYRQEGMARDQILVQVGRLRNQMRAEPQLDNAFKAKIEAHLIEVETALENKQWEAARQAATNAQGVWDKWRKGRSDWIDLLNCESQLQERLETENPERNISYLEEVRWELDEIRRERANQDNPQQFSKSLQKVQQQLNRYLQGKTQLHQFSELRNKLSQSDSKTEEFWRLEAGSLQQQFHNLSPSNDQAYKKWQETLKTKSKELFETLEEQQVKPASAQQLLVLTRSIETPPSSNLLNPVPTAHPLDSEKAGQLARQRLGWFNWFIYALAVILLGGAGFTELYAGRTTFGVNGLTDYFALLAWGFGAEATRESVTKVLKDFNLP